MKNEEQHTFAYDDFSVHATPIDPSTVRIDWEGKFMMKRDETPQGIGLSDFLMSVTQRGEVNMENLDFHFEGLLKMQSRMIKFLSDMFRQFAVGRKMISVTYASFPLQVQAFSSIANTLEVLQKKGALGRDTSEFRFVSVDTTTAP